MHARRSLTGALVVVSGTFIGALQQPVRDQPAARPTGSASISGIVTSDEPQPRPLRRARVMLRGADPVGSTVITNDDGTFAFEGLPAGRYAVSAAKDEYVTVNHGAPWQGGQGQRIPLADTELRTISIRLPRGAVIAGTLVDAFGQPAPGATVSALMWQYITATGERRLVSAGRSPGVTDDRGQYRIYGLPAGEYFVLATDALRTDNRGLVTTVGSDTRPIAPVPVAYPGSASLEGATKITVAAGDERTGVDFALQYATAASISVSVTSPDTATTPLRASLIQTNRFGGWTFRGGMARASANGVFEFGGLAPGAYTLFATQGSPVRAFASADLMIEGQDISSVQLTPQALPVISGRIVFEGRQHPPQMTTASQDLPLRFMLRGADASLSPSLQVADDGRFSVSQFVPGRYVLTDANRGIRAPVSGWWIRSVAIDGRELLDAPLELTQSEHVIVTLSDRASELSGVLRGSRGVPIPEHFVVAFSANRDHWFHQSRRVAGTLTDAGGAYSIKNLPAGDYLIATGAGLSTNEWFNPAILERLIQGARPFTLHDLEIKKLDLETDK
jgi:hypothetical protein